MYLSLCAAWLLCTLVACPPGNLPTWMIDTQSGLPDRGRGRSSPDRPTVTNNEPGLDSVCPRVQPLPHAPCTSS